MDKGNGKEDIKDEIEQGNSLFFFEALFKRVLGSLSFFEMEEFTALQHIKLIKAEQLRWKARWGVYWLQCFWPGDDHSALTDMEKSSLGDKGRPLLPLTERGNWFCYQFGFRAI